MLLNGIYCILVVWIVGFVLLALVFRTKPKELKDGDELAFALALLLWPVGLVYVYSIKRRLRKRIETLRGYIDEIKSKETEEMIDVVEKSCPDLASYIRKTNNEIRVISLRMIQEIEKEMHPD